MQILDHPHRGMTTGQTGIIGSGCHIYPCTLGGLSDKVQQRHPVIGDFVSIGTDAGIFGSVSVGDRSVIGTNAEIHGRVDVGAQCRIGASVFIGTIKDSDRRPGRVVLGEHVRIGAGTIIENASERDLFIPEQAEIPARSCCQRRLWAVAFVRGTGRDGRCGNRLCFLLLFGIDL